VTKQLDNALHCNAISLPVVTIQHKIRRSDINPENVEADNGDLHLILKTWTASARANFRWISTATFNSIHRRAILLELARSSVWCICNPDYSHQVFAWACADVQRGLLHYVYSKPEYRRMGLARSLLERIAEESESKLIATNRTPNAEQFLSRYFKRFAVELFQPQPKRSDHEQKSITQAHHHDQPHSIGENDFGFGD
jgi:GNAT superfamily N-acetyltransferase